MRPHPRRVAAFVLVAVASACSSNRVTIPPTPIGEIRESLQLPARPYGLAVAGSSAFVTQLDAAAVARFALSEPASAQSPFATGAIPTGVAATRDGGTLVVASQGSASVSLITVATGAKTVFRTTGRPFRAIVTTDGRRAYASTSTGEVLSIDLIGRRMLGTINAGSPLNGLALSPDETRLYVSSMYGGITIVDLGSFTVSRTLDVPGSLQEVVVSPDGSELYVADEGGRVVVVPLTGSDLTSVAVPGAFGMALSLDGSQLWITQPLLGAITMLDRATRSVIRTIRVQNDGATGVPRRIAFTNGGLAVVSDEAGSVHVIR
jgi:DNA-binding beta-propeller fold protein YncE